MQPTQVVKNANVMTLLIQEMANTNLIDLTSTDATRQGTNARTTINAGAAVESSTLQEEEAPTQGVGAGVDGKLLLQVSDLPIQLHNHSLFVLSDEYVK